jgi:tetratricopeptide (TPR) repeat protein
MQCPECGADAGDANFCGECGADLRDLTASSGCAACGGEVPEGAKFCPECGAPTGVRSAPAEKTAAETAPAAAGRRTGSRGKSAGAGRQRQERRQQPREQQPAAPSQQPRRVSPALAWSVLGAVVVVAIVVVVLFARGSGSGSVTPAPSAARSQRPVAADTSGSYPDLVQRANGLYDKGAAKFGAKDYEQGAAYFLAASKVYAAAWKQQATDPSVGTDFATSLFYSGDIDGAVQQVQKVLSKFPDFQTAWFNKGNYLSERARQVEQTDSKAADADYAEARIAYQKAIDLDPTSSSGQQAKERLSALPQ